MGKKLRLPYSDEGLARILRIDASELSFLRARDEIKKIVKDYNLFSKTDRAIEELSLLKAKYEKDEMTSSAISHLISYIKLR